MIVLNRYKAIFICVPKTGTRTIMQILNSRFGGSGIGEHKKILPKKYKDYYTFVVSRNPYDRICSGYYSTCIRGDCDKYGFKNRLGKNNNLENFLIHINPIPKQIDFYRYNKIDKILEFDNLEKEFNELPFVKDYIKLPVVNSTKYDRPHWTKILNKKTIHLVNKIYNEDFDLLNYKRIII